MLQYVVIISVKHFKIHIICAFAHILDTCPGSVLSITHFLYKHIYFVFNPVCDNQCSNSRVYTNSVDSNITWFLHALSWPEKMRVRTLKQSWHLAVFYSDLRWRPTYTRTHTNKINQMSGLGSAKRSHELCIRCQGESVAWVMNAICRGSIET